MNECRCEACGNEYYTNETSGRFVCPLCLSLLRELIAKRPDLAPCVKP